MNASEYARAFVAARREAMNMSMATRVKLRKIYLNAASQAAAVARDALERGLSELTEQRWASMAAQLQAVAEQISSSVGETGIDLVSKASILYPSIASKYLLAASIEAGATSITESFMGVLVAGVNRRLVEDMTSRLWADGYTFSQRVWKLQDDWLDTIKNLIASGIAQGRDPVKIAKDLQIYTIDGKLALVNRWGKLKRGTAEFAKRIPKDIDWRAARLVRSELFASLQNAGVAAGRINPGATGEYDWVLSPGRESWPCTCPELAKASPYKVDNIPTYPHSHCECSVRPRLRNRKEFVADLRSYFVQGQPVPYLDSWYRTVYREAA